MEISEAKRQSLVVLKSPGNDIKLPRSIIAVAKVIKCLYLFYHGFHTWLGDNT